MAIRERFSRMVRKSIASSSSSGTTRSDNSSQSCYQGGATSNTTSHSHDAVPKSTSSRLARITKSWRSSGSSTSKSNQSSQYYNNKNGPPAAAVAVAAAAAKAKAARLHPSERPLTEQNLRHQEMLSTFRITFGSRRRLSRGTVRSSFSAVSPGNSRSGSVDYGGRRRLSSLAVGAPPTAAAAATATATRRSIVGET